MPLSPYLPIIVFAIICFESVSIPLDPFYCWISALGSSISLGSPEKIPVSYSIPVYPKNYLWSIFEQGLFGVWEWTVLLSSINCDKVNHLVTGATTQFQPKPVTIKITFMIMHQNTDLDTGYCIEGSTKYRLIRKMTANSHFSRLYIILFLPGYNMVV